MTKCGCRIKEVQHRAVENNLFLDEEDSCDTFEIDDSECKYGKNHYLMHNELDGAITHALKRKEIMKDAGLDYSERDMMEYLVGYISGIAGFKVVSPPL
ncbi:MAG: hypothetical protein ACYDG3_12395 [Bacillati bacterium]